MTLLLAATLALLGVEIGLLAYTGISMRRTARAVREIELRVRGRRR